MVVFFKVLFYLCVVGVVGIPTYLSEVFHKPWWVLLLSALGVFLLAGIAYRVAENIAERIRENRAATAIAERRAMILDGLRTEDEFEKFIKTLKEYIDSSREVTYWHEAPRKTILLPGMAKYFQQGKRKEEDRHREAIVHFNESLDLIASQTLREPPGKAFPTVRTRLLAGLLNAWPTCGFRTYRKKILLRSYRDYINLKILVEIRVKEILAQDIDEETGELVDEFIMALRKDWHRSKSNMPKT